MAAGTVPLGADAAGRITASWTGVDAAEVTTALASERAVRPSALLSGELTAQGAGSEVTRWSANVRVAMASRGNAAGRIAVSGNTFVALEDGQWRMDGRHVVGGIAPITLNLRGDVENAIAGTVQIAETDLPGLIKVLRSTGVADVGDEAIGAGVLQGDVNVSGTLQNPGLDGHAVVRGMKTTQLAAPVLQLDFSGQPLASQLQFSLEVPEATAASQALSDVRSQGWLMDNLLVIDQLSASQPASAGRLTASGTYDIGARRYSATLEGTQWLVTAAADQPLAASLGLHFTGDGTVDQPRGTGELTMRDAMWNDIVLGQLDAKVELDGRVAHVDARAPEFATTATGRVALQAPYDTTVDVDTQNLDLVRLLRYVDTPTSIAGTTTLALHAELPLETWRRGSATLDVTSLDARAGDLPVVLADAARLRYEAERAYVDRFEIRAGDVTLSASGSLPVFDPVSDAPAVLLTAIGNVDEIVRAATALGLTELPVTGGDGPVALLSRVTGTLQQPVLAADLEVGPAALALDEAPQVTGVLVRAHAENGWLELREGAATYEGAQLAINGRAPLSMFSERLAATGIAGPPAGANDLAAVSARASNLTPAVLAPFVEPGTLDEVAGAIDASLEMSSPTLDLADVVGELRFDRFDVRVADLPLTQALPTRIAARDGLARVEAWEWVGQGTSLTVRGQVRLDDRQTAILANGTVDLRLLTPFVRTAGLTTGGRLEPRLSITGALDNPRVDGDIVLSDGELRLVEPRVLASDLTVRTVVTRTTARITELTGSINGGGITGGGTVEYTPDEGMQAELATAVRGMALEYPQGLRSELDADLNFAFRAPPGTSSEAPAGKLSGTVTVLRGAYREPMAVVTGLLASLQSQQLSAEAESSPFLDALALDIRVITDEDLLVDNNYARLELGGDLRIIGTARTPGMSGRAELREGGQLFVGRNVYTVNFGAIDFSNPVAIDPNLNIEATTRAGGQDIEVTIMGPAAGPAVDLRSTSAPELGQAEVASLLLTGRTLDNLAPDDAAFIGAQVLGNFSGEVLGFASRAVGLDTLRLGGVEGQTLRRDPTEVATTKEDPTNRVTFGKSLAPNLDLTLSQSLRDSDAQTWIVDYLPRRNLDLRVVSDDDDLRSYGFRHDLTFGTRAPAIQPRPPARPTVRVTAIDVSGNLVLPEMRVRGTLRLGPGDTFDFAEWQTDRDRLENLYRSEGYLTPRITPRRMEQDGGVTLAYSIEAGPRTVVTVNGIDLDAGLRSRLETAWFEAVFDEFVVDEAVQIVRDELGRRGYLQPTVDARIRDEGTTKTLEIIVEQGQRSMRTEVRIDGVPDETAAEIIDLLDERGVIDQAVTNPVAVEREVSSYLRVRGYARARVTTGAPVFADGTATLPVTVDAGPVFTVLSVTFEGGQALPEETRREALAVDLEMPYDPDVVEGARGRLVALYRREGFASAAVIVRPDIDQEQARVALTFVVEEGPRQVLKDIVVTGNRAIDTDVIVRALRLSLEEPLRANEVLQARTRVFETGLFRRIDVTPEQQESTADDVTPMRLRVTVEEWPAVRLRYGFVVAEERPEDNPEGRELVPGFSADLTRRTVFGRAITVGTALAFQRREQGARLFGNAPTFLGLPIESSLVGERSRQEIQAVSLVTSLTSVTWEQRARVLARRLNLSYSYTFERQRTFDTKSMEDDPLAFDVTLNITRWNGATAWDDRDDPLDATRGKLLSSSFEYGRVAASVSSDKFVRELAQAYYFRSWRRVVFASAARWGIMVPVGGEDLFRQEMFFAGGSRTVRGVGENDLGPRSVFEDEPAGGQTMVVLNQEVRFPVYGWVRGVTFIDAGNVFARPRDTSLRDLVGAIGFGIRVSTPFALLRADYGRVMWGRPDQSSGRWSFGIGQIF
jgi:outer membrane protein assembly factor BamA/autotransporter translocation and assembly factor TamB